MDRRRLSTVARRRLGIERLRPEQRRAAEAAAEGRDVLVVMPTGAGKSAIYQLAGLLRPGPTLVVSPLIALQRDQASSIEALEAGGAAHLNSLQSAGDRDDVLEDLQEAAVEFVFLAPEQLESDEVLTELRASAPSLVAVDEAHCVSQWGHDFRPAFLGIASVVEALGRPPVLALTATAAPPVREEIVERLGMRDPLVVATGFDRPNIWLDVRGFHDAGAKRDALLAEVASERGPGIVYVARRRDADALVAELRERGVEATAYHAGLRRGDRERAQQDFMDGRAAVVVATTAFGMGIDKPDVRFVFHLDVSESLDAYYQEIGRAGRDGEPAVARLFYRAADLGLRRFFAGGRVEPEHARQVVETVRRSRRPVGREFLRLETGLSRSRVAGALAALEAAGAIRRVPRGRVVPTGRRGVAAVVDEARAAEERRLAFERSRIEMIRAYAESDDCRRRALLGYFGEALEEPCGSCDNCDAGRSSDAGGDDGPFAVGGRVEHREWGQGTVQRYEDGTVVVLFDDAGYRSLAVDVVVEEALLRPA